MKRISAVTLGIGIFLAAHGAFAAADLDARGTVVSVDAANNEVVIQGDSGAQSTMKLDAATIAKLKPGQTIKASLEDAK